MLAQPRTIELGDEMPPKLSLTPATRSIAQAAQTKVDPMPKLDLLTELKKRIIGQDHVLEDIVSTFYRWEIGLSPEGTPAGSFLFLGPTGTGKTRSIEALAEVIHGDAKGFIKVDCAEFQHSHEIAKLLGSPPGYLGHRETHPALTQNKLNAQHNEMYKCSFLLLDEIEKASDALWNLLLGILDKATLTLGDNSRVDFSSTFVFMTSNLGAREMQEAVEGSFGFHESSLPLQDVSQKKLDMIALQAAKRRFTPEFMNRIDTKVVYRTLSKESLSQILDQQLVLLQKRILSGLGARGFVLEVLPETREFLLTKGISKVYGARELKRTIESNLTTPLVHQIRNDPGEWGALEAVQVGVKDGSCVFKKVK